MLRKHRPLLLLDFPGRQQEGGRLHLLRTAPSLRNHTEAHVGC